MSNASPSVMSRVFWGSTAAVLTFSSMTWECVDRQD